jgi:pimeloyl-ACP methyl ester carboxylesterase
MQEFAEDCVALLDHLGWESAHVCGVSMGGMIAQELALTAPTRVRSLTLIVTQPGGIMSMIPTLRGIPRFLRAQLATTPEGRIRALRSLLVPPQAQALVDVSEIDRKLREDFSPKPPTSTRLSHLRAIRKHDTRRRLKDLRAPTLIVRAEDDLLVHPKHSLTLSRLIPHAELVSFEHAGHGVIRQRNVPLNETLARHLADAERSASGEDIAP